MFTLLFCPLLLFAHPAAARENPYDVVGKVFAPFVSLFVASGKSPNHAVAIELSLEAATGAADAAQAIGQTITVEFQMPDKLRLSLPGFGKLASTGFDAGTLTLCRNGQDLWACPGAKIEALINRQRLPQADPDFKLAPFRLPVPEKQLVFLPALFKVTDEGDETVDGEACRVLGLALIPELARSLKVEEWSALVWVRADYRPAKIELIRREQHFVIAVKKLEYSPALPPETWQAPALEVADVLHLTPVRYKQLLDAAMENLTIVKHSK